MQSLAGKSIWVTAERRAHVQQAFIEKRGGRVELLPLLRTIDECDIPSLAHTVEAMAEEPPDLLIAQTGQGMQWWSDRLCDQSRQRFFGSLERAEVWSRGAKSSSRCRSLGLPVHWEAPSETTAEIVARCAEVDLAGARVALQLVGVVDDPVRTALVDAGADVVELRVYRYDLPKNPEEVRSLARRVVDGEIDAITFTASPAISNLWDLLRGSELADQFLAALGERCLPVVVGPVCASTARTLGWHGIVEPETARLVPMLHAAEEALLLSAKRPL